MENSVKPYFVVRPHCPLCRGMDTSTLLTVSYSDERLEGFLQSYYHGKIKPEHLRGAQYILEECNDCGFIFQKEIPNAELSRILYEPPFPMDPQLAFERYESNRSLGYFLAYVPQLVSVIRHFGVSPRRLTFLDFGMGWGNWCRLAMAFGCDVYGLESSPVRREYARQTGIKTVTWDEIQGMEFDFINAEQVFEHVDDPLGILRYLTNSLSPRAVIKLSVPDCWDIKKKIRICDGGDSPAHGKSMRTAHPLEHINCFTHETLIRMATLADLEVVDVPITMHLSVRSFFRSLLRPTYWLLTGRKSTCLFFKKTGSPPLPGQIIAGRRPGK